VRPLAGWGDKRVAALPEVPTFKELGYPDAEFYIWAGVFAPKGTPEPVVAKLRATPHRPGRCEVASSRRVLHFRASWRF
jgi:tripartite-type tricarboxylate transporter receptor subunit TctC